ncbi:MAG: glycosyltransferase family 39 protein [Candidatus Promineofilum sp.]|nr:glycosyltransferase family 39 protein [Promineifilum sp.]
MHIHPRAERRLLALILALFVLLGFSYALITPAFEASDELWHYPMVRHLADGNPLPVQVFDPALAGPWNQEASQPPLYYALAAALTFWIDTADMEQVRWLNPHVDNGVITPDGNINLAIHAPAADPWAGTLLAIRVIRLFSVLLGAATVYLTYRIAAEVAPGRPEVALLAAALNAFLPMFLFISGAVNNDNLAVPLASLALLLMIRIVTKRAGGYTPVRWTEWAAVGVVLGLAALTKEGTLGLFPLALGTAVVSAWQRAAEEERNAERRGGQTRRDAEGVFGILPPRLSALLCVSLRRSSLLSPSSPCRRWRLRGGGTIAISSSTATGWAGMRSSPCWGSGPRRPRWCNCGASGAVL